MFSASFDFAAAFSFLWGGRVIILWVPGKRFKDVSCKAIRTAVFVSVSFWFGREVGVGHGFCFYGALG